MSAETWVRDLEAAGWTKYNGSMTVWRSPWGALYRGPYLAWTIMNNPVTGASRATPGAPE